MMTGGFTLVFVASKGRKETRMSWVASGDPGCISTTVYMAELAIVLALNRGQLPLKGGVLTPVSACGYKLWERLKEATWTHNRDLNVKLSWSTR